jgi:hypothetical protein
MIYSGELLQQQEEASMQTLFVGGHFDSRGGHPSRAVRTLAYGLYTTVVNGGTLYDLESLISRDLQQYQAVVWMPNISNSEDKFLPRIKKECPRILLVSSKRNEQKKYSFTDIVSRALASRSQLLIEVVGGDFLGFRLVDPLGNVSREFPSTELGLVGFRDRLYERIQFLLRAQRVPSTRAHTQALEQVWPVDPQFLEAIRGYAECFHVLVHGENPSPRFMGNASFRCTRGGFPSYRGEHGSVYVSRRNIDKRCLDAQGFVQVRGLNYRGLDYWGEHKPSVDTPVQLKLYEHFPRVRYMLHAHVYHEHGTWTHRYVPCGDLREVPEILGVIENPSEQTGFIVNLKGHGCVIASSDVDDMLGHQKQFYARPVPEQNL